MGGYIKHNFQTPHHQLEHGWQVVCASSHWPIYTPAHRPIKACKSEQTIGWLFHYIIGIGYAYLYVMLMVFIVIKDPSLTSAIIYGLVTLIAPWLVLQPALGLGLFARLADKPNTIRALNLFVHLIFGLALYFSWTLSLALF